MAAKRRVRKAPAVGPPLRPDEPSALSQQMVSGGRLGRARVGQPSRQRIDPFDELYTVEGGAIPPPLNPLQLLDLIEDNPVHGACVYVKAVDAAGRGWEWTAVDPEGSNQDDIDTLDATLRALSPRYPLEQLLLQAAYEMVAVGWSAWEVTREATGALSAIYPIPAQTIRVTRTEDVYVQTNGMVSTYFVAFGSDLVLDPETGKEVPGLGWDERASEVILFRHYSTRSPDYSVPAWFCAVPAIRETTAIREYNVAFFSSGAQGDYAIHVAADTIETAQQLADEIKGELQDNGGVPHTTLVTSGTKDVQVTTTTLTPPSGREGHFRMRRGDLVREILMGHQVPPYRIGWAEVGALSGNVAEDMLEAYKYGAIKPIQTVLLSALEATLLGPKGLGIDAYTFGFVDFTLDDLTAEMALATAGINAGMYTLAEGRQLIGAPPDDDPALQQRYISAGVVPITDGPVQQRAAVDVLQAFERSLSAVLEGGPPPAPPVIGAPPVNVTVQQPAPPPPAPPPLERSAPPDWGEIIGGVVDRIMGRIEASQAAVIEAVIRSSDGSREIARSLTALSARDPQPIHVHMPAQTSRKILTRDPVSGLITGVEEAPPA